MFAMSDESQPSQSLTSPLPSPFLSNPVLPSTSYPDKPSPFLSGHVPPSPFLSGHVPPSPFLSGHVPPSPIMSSNHPSQPSSFNCSSVLPSSGATMSDIEPKSDPEYEPDSELESEEWWSSQSDKSAPEPKVCWSLVSEQVFFSHIRVGYWKMLYIKPKSFHYCKFQRSPPPPHLPCLLHSANSIAQCCSLVFCTTKVGSGHCRKSALQKNVLLYCRYLLWFTVFTFWMNNLTHFMGKSMCCHITPPKPGVKTKE